MAPDMHIVVCDDEADLRETVGEYLQRRGHRVTLAAHGRELDAALDANEDVAIVLLDINMPGEDGLSILRRIRNERDLAVILLTAAGEVVDKIVGLEMGADDYLPKPVDLRELEARVKAVMRRAEKRVKDLNSESSPNEKVRFAGYTVDLEAAQLLDDTGGEIALTAMEFRLLKVFIENRGRVLNRDQLLELAHDRGWDPFDRSIDIRVSRLRRKIEKVPSKPEIIRTVRSLGYVFDPGPGSN